MARADVGDRGIFVPLGTRGDLVMELLSMSSVSGEELGPQLLAQFDSSGQIDTLLQPGILTPTEGSAGDIFASHDIFVTHKIVFRDPSNIAYLTQAVLQARSSA